MYVTGEKIFFSVLVYNVNENLSEKFSRIFYCELITPDGNKIAGGKYLLQSFTGQGCLTIPEETLSGIYFLKFYTRFMRNVSTAEYKYIMLKIINPDKTEVLSGNDDRDTLVQAEKTKHGTTVNQTLNILSGKKIFSPREEIRIKIGVDTGQQLHNLFCLSVIPVSTFEDLIIPQKNDPNPSEKGFYLPETRGISLSGQLISKETGRSIHGAKVNLSIIGDKDILVVITDTSGRFYFPLPDFTGNKDIFLCADDLPDITPEILIDNDFCSRPVSLPSVPFRLNEKEMKAAFTLAVNSMITSVFLGDTAVSDTSGVRFNISFYGKPSEVLLLKKYIDLPTLEEYFTELPVMVSLRKIKGRKQFRFYNTLPEMSIYDPLLLVDWVAVNDIKKILAMSPLEIERIELVDEPYVKGNITYGGIISFISRKNDFAGIDLPKSGTFVNYSFLKECAEHLPPMPLPGNIPDSRNTVYWNPDVRLTSDGTASISFTAPDTPGKYTILFRATNSTGNVFLTEETIVVEND